MRKDSGYSTFFTITKLKLVFGIVAHSNLKMTVTSFTHQLSSRISMPSVSLAFV